MPEFVLVAFVAVIVVWLVAQADRSARSDRRKTPTAPRSGATGHARPAALRPLPPPGKARSAPTHPATPPDRDRDRCPKLYGTRLQGRARVIDGDTIVVAGQRIRLAGIDAPELDEPFGQESKWEMVRLCQGQKITVRLNGFRSYERVVGFCYLPDGTDLGAELVRRGLALDWALFSGGHYRHLEPDGVRRKLLSARRWHREQTDYAARHAS